MAVRVLIVSPDTGFGGLIQQTLEKSGNYEPILVSTGNQALELARQRPVDLAILDADTADLKVNELGSAMQAIRSEMRILLIPSDEPDDSQATDAMHVNGYLTKPFYLPDLVDIVDSALADEPDDKLELDAQTDAGIVAQQADGEVPGEPSIVETPARKSPSRTSGQNPWSGNITLAAQHLARLSMSTSSQAALVLRDNQLWAYAGQLSQEAAHELAQLVQQGWRPDLHEEPDPAEPDVDLARFVHLETTGKEHLLYATSLENDLLLVLAFDARTPFSDIRNQANNLAASLATKLDERLPNNDQTLEPFIVEPTEKELIDQSMPDVRHEQNDELGWALEFDSGLDDGTDDSKTAIDEDSTQPVRVNHSSKTNPPSSSAMLFDLHYACILVPRLPEHYLIGDLSTLLSQWMRRLSLAFGWRLEYLAMRPGWMQWIASVEPDTCAEHVVQQIRRGTSDLIFAEFPRYATENPSADFWAPGYLVMSSSKPLPGEIVKEFTERTRLKQGVPAEN
jgi:DNA-binding response OmpR family regulator/REP element-mobilizing transposase RayT